MWSPSHPPCRQDRPRGSDDKHLAYLADITVSLALEQPSDIRPPSCLAELCLYDFQLEEKVLGLR